MTNWAVAIAFIGSSQSGLEEIKEGDCLTMIEIQELTGVTDGSLYEADSCEVDYPASGELSENLACGLMLPAGQWSRKVVEHKKPGFFWPRPVPCQASVIELQKEVFFHDLKDPAATSCKEEETFISVFQTETLKSAVYKAGQGDLYLPSPLLVHREEFGYNVDLGVSLSTCKQTELTGRYLGMSDIQIKLEERVCGNAEALACKLMTVSPQTNSEGKTCAYIESLGDCPKR